ncbi:MAG: hypothetical protein ACPIG6_07865 [Akkermansiaceae bacterium]
MKTKDINEDYLSGRPVVITLDDLQTVAKDMITICGYNPDSSDGYSDALLDSLTNHMNLEGLITTLLIKHHQGASNQQA